MKVILPAEWEPQDVVQLSWPRRNSDWSLSYNDAQLCFAAITKAIIRFQKVFIVSEDQEATARFFSNVELNKIKIISLEHNDSWARDHGGITVEIDGKFEVQDYYFNGWGSKFVSGLDNQLTKKLFKQNIFSAFYKDNLNFVLEGGAIESDGKGTLLTTKKCLLNSNRNPNLSEGEIEEILRQELGFDRFLWLENGDLEGDDTDAHIDTLARFCSENTIAYVQCTDQSDTHFEELNKMESELKNFTDRTGKAYNLIPLPMPTPQLAIEGNYRLPATYANFLIINGAVLLPIYNCKEDDIAVEQLKKTFPDREIIPINCVPLIQQHGSLHCVTMQYPKGSYKS